MLLNWIHMFYICNRRRSEAFSHRWTESVLRHKQSQNEQKGSFNTEIKQFIHLYYFLKKKKRCPKAEEFLLLRSFLELNKSCLSSVTLAVCLVL